PNAALAKLTNHKNLGLHTEMFSDGVIDLIENDIINCNYKGTSRGRALATFLVGSRRLYDFVNDNPFIEMKESSIVNDTARIRKNPKMEPYSDEHVLSIQEISDIAAYLQSVPIQQNTAGFGSGNELVKGQALYLKDCAVCHGNQGEGNARKFIPLIAGQYYKYLLRELGFIQTEKRGNANPDMVIVLKLYGKEDLEAVADYVSRIPIGK
ncbi:MAG: c-type cytochrome, partial [Limnohabitans sp.]